MSVEPHLFQCWLCRKSVTLFKITGAPYARLLQRIWGGQHGQDLAQQSAYGVHAIVLLAALNVRHSNWRVPWVIMEVADFV